MDKKEPLKEDAAKTAQQHGAENAGENAGKSASKQRATQQKLDGPQERENENDGKLAEISDQLLRIHAEFDNYKKRTVKEKEQLVHSSEARLMLRMIPVYEEIDLAQKEVAKLPEGEVKKGVLLVLGKLRASFEKEGLQEMKSEGERFDPYKHDCALQEESEKPEGEIVKVIQKGYAFRGEVLRHAVVSISAGAKKAEAGSQKSAETNKE